MRLISWLFLWEIFFESHCHRVDKEWYYNFGEKPSSPRPLTIAVGNVKMQFKRPIRVFICDPGPQKVLCWTIKNVIWVKMIISYAKNPLDIKIMFYNFFCNFPARQYIKTHYLSSNALLRTSNVFFFLRHLDFLIFQVIK